ncbi:hypothetical protein LUZ63_006228 [Rhynchospora breviuscula]|uniref:Rubredoxin-like domain-containing protein n=1 Tax=Rhynchospora breviuscula TaxID=2022672 RepID=A0A9Q0CPE1_9POAL|nr:hypothetical protein LUZ63_006228 [Rhynchospora breviuscula]
MASAIVSPTFIFTPHQTKKPQTTSIAPQWGVCRRPVSLKPLFITSSVDLSQEDKPLEAETTIPEAAPEEATEIQDQDQPKVDPRRFEEKFAVINTGIYECRSCGYRYDQAVGDPSYPIAPGLEFSKLPSDWRCPTCGAAQSFFESKSVEIAGFAQNQQFGLGGNSLTSGQKTLLIYGSLLFFFALFISGYFLQ